MKYKNVSYLERNIEKIVLAVAAVFALLVAGYYFLVAPFNAQVDFYRPQTSAGGQMVVRTEKVQVNPQNIEEVIKEQANVLGTAIRSEKSPLPTMNVPQYAKDFNRVRSAPISPLASLPVPLGELGMTPARGSNGFAREWPRYNLPTAPAPVKPLARVGFAVLADSQSTQNPQLIAEYEELIGKQVPRDFHYVSLSSEFDLQKWVDSLRQNASHRIPDEWIRGLLLLTTVQIERQTLDPVTGQWGAIESGRFEKDQVHVVASLPAYPKFRRRYDRLNDRDAEELVLQLRRVQQAITQPEFPILASGQWFPPDVDLSKLSEAEKAQLHEVLRRIREKERAQSTDVNEALDTSGAGSTFMTPGIRPMPFPTRAPDDEDPMLMPRSPVGTGGVVSTPGVEVTATELTELYKLRDKLLGKPTTDEPVTAKDKEKERDRLGRRDLRNVGKINLLAHDLTAQPGHEYRYRLSVGIYNPLFRRRQVDSEQLKQSFNTLAILSPASEWSQPVRTEPTHYYFLLSATPDLRSATWEIWRIFNGYWASHRHTSNLGDLIGGSAKLTVNQVSSEVDFSLPLMLVDLDQVEGRSVGIPTSRAVVLNTITQQLFDRTVSDDAADSKRKQLRDSEMAAAAPTVPKTPTPTMPPGVRPRPGMVPGFIPPDEMEEPVPPGTRPPVRPVPPRRQPTPPPGR